MYTKIQSGARVSKSLNKFSPTMYFITTVLHSLVLFFHGYLVMKLDFPVQKKPERGNAEMQDMKTERMAKNDHLFS